jgi:transposase-like protein
MGKAEELAAALEKLEGGRGKRRKYPMELRLRLIDFVREQRAAGIQLKTVAARVGVSPTLPIGGR